MLDRKRLEDFYGGLFKNANMSVLNPKYEDIIENIYLQILKPGDDAVDVGSQRGLHAIPMAEKIAPSGTVFSFEPMPHTFAEQKRKLDRLSLTNVVLKNLALSNFTGESSFRVVKDAPGLSGLQPMPHQENHEIEIITVKVSTLDREIANKEKIAFIKIDTEGGDFFVLQGAAQLLKIGRPLVVFECGAYLHAAARHYSYSKEDFISFFKEVEYDLNWIDGLAFNPDLWKTRVPPYLVGIPAEKKNRLREILQLSVLAALIPGYKNAVQPGGAIEKQE